MIIYQIQRVSYSSFKYNRTANILEDASEGEEEAIDPKILEKIEKVIEQKEKREAKAKASSQKEEGQSTSSSLKYPR